MGHLPQGTPSRGQAAFDSLSCALISHMLSCTSLEHEAAGGSATLPTSHNPRTYTVLTCQLRSRRELQLVAELHHLWATLCPRVRWE
jgi:hypothetical protein